MPFVLDSSVVLAWILPDESNATIDHVCDRLIDESALVPPVWPLEIGNVLLVAIKRGRLTVKDLHRLIRELRALPIQIDATSTERSFDETLVLAQQHGLTTYDASYLELAQRRDVPLATLDTRLRTACVAAQVTLLPSSVQTI